MQPASPAGMEEAQCLEVPQAPPPCPREGGLEGCGVLLLPCSPAGGCQRCFPASPPPVRAWKATEPPASRVLLLQSRPWTRAVALLKPFVFHPLDIPVVST